MISEYFILSDETQRIDKNSDGVIGVQFTEWEKEDNENQVIEITLLDEDKKILSQIFISKDDFIKVAKRIMVE